MIRPVSLTGAAAAAGALLLAILIPVQAQPPAQYAPGPDSMPQPGVPKGEVLQRSFEASRIFPGTYRDYWIYVPAQYRPDKPACLYVNQDGIQWQAPVVFDNLIAKGEMPVTIGVFVMHGRVRAADPAQAEDRYNRSLEYDGLGDRYARFLVDELLPEVERQTASDGRRLRISKRPEDRAIGGSSSGAVCAFTAAWERPDQFSRVFSAIGTYVGLRGADRYPTLIRKYEPKPLRIFLQDGSSDLNIYAGDWWMANQMMLRALQFAGYEVKHEWGEGGHSGQHGTALFPDAMRWLWKGWPAAPGGSGSGNDYLRTLLKPGEGWRQAAGAAPLPRGLASAGDRGVEYLDRAGRLCTPAGSRPADFAKGVLDFAPAPGGGRLLLLPNGLYRHPASGGSPLLVSPRAKGDVLTVNHRGTAFVAAPELLRSVDSEGRVREFRTSVKNPGGVALSPDQTFLYLTDRDSHWIYSFQVAADGSLAHGQQYGWLHLPDEEGRSEAGGMAVDREGRLYVATNLGVQVLDQPGRVHAILPLPDRVPAVDLHFGGGRGGVLYVTGQDGRLFSRELNTTGLESSAEPKRPPRPGL